MSEEIKRGPGRPKKILVTGIAPSAHDHIAGVEFVGHIASELAESEGDFISRHEDQSRAKGVVVTKVIYPGAKVRVYQGLYSGIPVEDGAEAVAIYNDGSRNK